MLTPARRLPVGRLVLASAIVASCGLLTAANASDWTRFRGENGAGVSADSAPIPSEWGDSKNLKWSADLPGDGKSCPIVVGDRVILTAWTGTGPEDLMRHVLCFDRNTGKQLWKKDVPPAAPDEPYKGMFQQNGYASHTPVSDGERIFVFFGVSGVYAYDMDGKELWHQSVGTGFNSRDWGSSASPILYKDTVIITAGAESNSMIALAKDDGHEVWKQEAEALNSNWGTPVLLQDGDNQTLVIAVGGEMWGINPDTGKLRWNASTGQGDGMRMSAIVDGGLAIVLGERDGRAIAVKPGGEGDVTESHVVWNQNQSGSIGTPVAHEGLIYWIAGGQAHCIDAKTGEEVYQARLEAPAAPAGATPPAAGAAAPSGGEGGTPAPGSGAPGAGGGGDGQGAGPGGGGGRGGRRGGRGGRGGMGSQDYSSPVLADGKLIFARRDGNVYVFATGREFKQLAVNKFTGEADYSASPAVSNGQLFIRSSKKLYCIAAE